LDGGKQNHQAQVLLAHTGVKWMHTKIPSGRRFKISFLMV